MEDIVNAFKATLYERIASPLASAFAVSWLIWNFKLVLLVFFSDGWIVLEEGIHQYYFASVDWLIPSRLLDGGHYLIGVAFSNLVMPSVITAAYIFLYPKLAEPVYSFTIRKNVKLKQLKIEAEETTPIDQREARELYRKLSQLQIEFDEETRRYRNNIDSLEQTVQKLKLGKNNDISVAESDKVSATDSLRDTLENTFTQEEKSYHTNPEDELEEIAGSLSLVSMQTFNYIAEQGVMGYVPTVEDIGNSLGFDYDDVRNTLNNLLGYRVLRASDNGEGVTLTQKGQYLRKVIQSS